MQPASSQTTIGCNGGTATFFFNDTGATEIYSLSLHDALQISGIFTHAAGTNLAYSVTDVNSCNAATGTFTVVQPAVISVSNVSQSTIACKWGADTAKIPSTSQTVRLFYTVDEVTNATGIFTDDNRM